MTSTSRLFRGAIVLTVGQVLGYGLSFGRNVILARMLTKADFGLAAMFGMTLSLLEVSGRMSFGQQIIQSKDGDSASFQGTSHALQFALSMLGGLLILLLSRPMAQAFNVPSDAWAFAALAVVPFARGFEHLDYYRLQRELNYVPAVLRDVIPQAVATLAAWPLTIWLRDFSVIIWLVIGRAFLAILMTHLLAARKYRWAWHKSYISGMWNFGWPLLITGLLMFASQEADQMVVGSFLSLDRLASYALAFSLVSIPWFIFGQVGTSIMLPILARSQADPKQFRQEYQTCLKYTAVGATVLMLPLIVGGEQIVALIYGPRYSGTGILMALLGAASAVRFLRFAPAVAAMARADTVNQLYSNLARGLSLPLAILAATSGLGAVWIAACALTAEMMAAMVSVERLRRRQGVPIYDTIGPAAYILGFIGMGLTFALLSANRLNVPIAVIATLGALLAALLIAGRVFPEVFRDAMSSIRRRSRTARNMPLSAVL